ncbi:hypothetical protein SCHIN_v1c03180 [Spiroplasma chinense]|uniref:Transmembrane protein n=1 Tax=Spiroplasma chinense TaxID=216932 RepID=A0A5B9Y3Y9_9MOLU|nr:hypothetical protein [Spiroplasma chinense]QEH61515.1 hypothetical protein SCHIN_v1c03180 [Spiroplasma chinense]
MAKKEKLPKKEKQPKGDKQGLGKKIKDNLKLRNFKASSLFLNIFVIAFRVAAYAFWIIAPVLLAFALVYDQGARNFYGYILLSIFGKTEKIDGEYIATKDNSFVNTTVYITAPILWLILVILIYAFVTRPIMKKTLWRQRMYLSINLYFWAILFWVLLYMIWILLPNLPGDTNVDENGYINPKDAFYSAALKTFTPFSGWSIVYQVFCLCIIIFATFAAIEASLIRKLKLDFDSFYKPEFNERSLVNQVIEGRLQFGETDPGDLKAEIKKLRNDLDMERKERKMKELERIEYEAKQKKEAKKNAKNKKKNKL